jgi:hypothetical protein
MILGHTPFLLAGGLAFLALLVQKHKGYKSTKTDTPEARFRISQPRHYYALLLHAAVSALHRADRPRLVAYEQQRPLSRLRKVCIFLAYERYAHI